MDSRKKGAKCVEIVGTDDKRQITATVAGTMSGKFLPAQLIRIWWKNACVFAKKLTFLLDGPSLSLQIIGQMKILSS